MFLVRKNLKPVIWESEKGLTLILKYLLLKYISWQNIFFLHSMLTFQLSATILEVSVFSQRVNSEIVSKRLTDYQWLCLHVQNFLRSDSKLWFIRKCMIGICI